MFGTLPSQTGYWRKEVWVIMRHSNSAHVKKIELSNQAEVCELWHR